MPFFPAFIDLKDKKVLIVGGGKVATRKVKSILNFTKNVKIVSPKITAELKSLIENENLKWVKRKFKNTDLKGIDLVIVAVDDLKLQKRIFKICEKRKILCNSVDSIEYCNFIFPSLIIKGDLVIGISTSGKVPALSRALREKIEKCIPENVDKILEKLEEIRKSEEKGKERQEKLLKLARELINS